MGFARKNYFHFLFCLLCVLFEKKLNHAVARNSEIPTNMKLAKAAFVMAVTLVLTEFLITRRKQISIVLLV